METYRTEEEQIEALKGWVKEYGRSVVVGVALCLILVFGWRAWRDYGQQSAQMASAAYDTLYQAVRKASEQDATSIDRSTVDTMAEPLQSEWSDTTYADLSQLLLARQAVYDGQLEKARDALAEVVTHADDEAIRHIARLRLARVLLALKDYDSALSEALPTDDPVFDSAYWEVRGDVFLAKGDSRAAFEAYDKAIKASD
ncbi:MAG: tetratricopeptide repeat protein, partial [Gammaproteobacteria bacterium]